LRYCSDKVIVGPLNWLDEAATALEASEEELKLLRPVYEAARGLCHGTDWNNGNHARLHGYREKLIAATATARATLRNREQGHD